MTGPAGPVRRGTAPLQQWRIRSAPCGNSASWARSAVATAHRLRVRHGGTGKAPGYREEHWRFTPAPGHEELSDIWTDGDELDIVSGHRLQIVGSHCTADGATP
jgi:hypothetical protein